MYYLSKHIHIHTYTHTHIHTYTYTFIFNIDTGTDTNIFSHTHAWIHIRLHLDDSLMSDVYHLCGMIVYYLRIHTRIPTYTYTHIKVIKGTYKSPLGLKNNRISDSLIWDLYFLSFFVKYAMFMEE